MRTVASVWASVWASSRRSARLGGAAALALLALLAGTTVALAATRGVDPGGICNGNSPCYTTIQAAVNAAGPNDVINVFPGTYAEDVDLNGMATMGNIALRTVNAAGAYTPGTATATGIRSGNAFTGSIGIAGFNLGGGTNPGIATNGSNGNVAIADVTVTGAQNKGIQLLLDTGNVLLRSTEVTGNDNDGILVSHSPFVSGTLTISDVVATGNAGGGVIAYAFSTVRIHNSDASRNGYIGWLVRSEPASTIEVYATTAYSNGTASTLSFDTGGFQLSNTGVLATVDGASPAGVPPPVDCSAPPELVLDRVEAKDNFGDGVRGDIRGRIRVNDTRAENNAYNGFALYAPSDCAPTVVITASHAISNALAGFQVAGQLGVQVTASSAERNGWDGFCALADGPIAFADSNAAENGVNAGPGAAGVSNAYAGFQVNANQCFGVLALAADASPAAAAQVGARPSFPAPAEAAGGSLLPGDVSLARSTAERNAGSGIVVTTGDRVTVTQVSALNNLLDGIRLHAVEPSTPTDTTLPLLSAAQMLASSITDSFVYSNGIGVHYAPALSSLPPAAGAQGADGVNAAGGAPASDHAANGNVICRNVRVGLGIEPPSTPVQAATIISTSVVNAEGNYWGSLSGPTHPGNPGGTGDVVVDQESTGDLPGYATVDFTPWIEAVTGSASPATSTPGVPVAVEFVLSDAAKGVFLGQGPGDPNNGGLFTLATDNGTLSGSGGSGASIPAAVGSDGRIVAQLTPGTAGQATVTLTGPCMDPATLTLPAATAAISVEKGIGTSAAACAPRSAPLVVARNTPVYFCVVITNTGSVELAKHTIVDPLLGINMTVDATLAPGATVNVTNALIPALGPVAATVDLTNTVTVTSTDASASAATAPAAGTVALDVPLAFLPLIER